MHLNWRPCCRDACANGSRCDMHAAVDMATLAPVIGLGDVRTDARNEINSVVHSMGGIDLTVLPSPFSPRPSAPHEWT